jgi:hypothetical protein
MAEFTSTFGDLECLAFAMADRFAKRNDYAVFDELKAMPGAKAAIVGAMMHYRVCNVYMARHHDFLNGLMSRVESSEKP